MRRLALLVISVSLLALAFLPAGCASTVVTSTAGGTAATIPPPPPSPPSPKCAWYTPMTGPATGQTVTVTAAGPACRSQALIAWIARETNRPWATTAAAAANGMPVTAGTLIAQLTRGGTTIRIWQDGFAGVTDQAAGGLAGILEQNGWTPAQPACPCGPAPEFTYTTYPAGSTLPG